MRTFQKDNYGAESGEEMDLSVARDVRGNTSGYTDEADTDEYNRRLEALEDSVDPVTIYLREMSQAPLLTREGEVCLAKRIERGQMRSLKAFSRSYVVWAELVQAAEALRRHQRSIGDIVDLGDAPLSPKQREKRSREFVQVTARIMKLRKFASREDGHPVRTPKSNSSSLTHI